jgi:hypothetical protein
MPRLRNALFAMLLVVPGAAAAGSSAPPSTTTTPPEDTVLGTVQVTGSAGVGIVYPKIAVVPILTKTDADTLSQLVTARDFELSGEYDVVNDNLPDGPFLRDDVLDYDAWKKKNIEVVVRVWADGTGASATLFGDLHFTTEKLPKDDPTWKAAYETKVSLAKAPAGPSAGAVRGATHVLVDRLFGALTGKPGAFASELTYSATVGKARQVRRLDADGFNLRDFGPGGETTILPQFGTGGDIWFAISKSYSPYRLAHGAAATELSLTASGSLLGYSFSPAHDKLAVALMSDGVSTIYLPRQSRRHGAYLRLSTAYQSRTADEIALV